MDVFVTGIGMTPVNEHWGLSLIDLAVEAATQALESANNPSIELCLVGNMLSGQLNRQENLAACIIERIGLSGTPAIKVESACASSASALYLSHRLISSGACSSILIIGVEKMTDAPSSELQRALATSCCNATEGLLGFDMPAHAAIAMSAYCSRYNVDRFDFAEFSINAHKNSKHNKYAMLRKPITHDDYVNSLIVASPICIQDCAPICDGASAIVLQSKSAGKYISPLSSIVAVASCTDSVTLAHRNDILELNAVSESVARALQDATISREEVDIFELHDAFSVVAALTIEASGFCKKGQAVQLMKDGYFSYDGKLPIQTMGGLKARGHPVGATGLYQIIEATLQLSGCVSTLTNFTPKIALCQNIGGYGANVVTSVVRYV